MSRKPETAGGPPAAASSLPDAGRLSAIIPEVYDELRRLARWYTAGERRGRSLQATELVDEAFIKLKKAASAQWHSRPHFCAIAAHAMREILVERARARAAAKRGGSRVRISLSDAGAAREPQGLDLLALHEALDRLARQDAALAHIVELRFFGGMTIEETAEALSSSPASVKRGWNLARAWLRKELE